MPIYEYRCDNGHDFEAFQSMSDDPIDVCEVCDAPSRRMLSAPAVHFKGSGFYTTDYARKGASSSNGSDGSSSKDGSSSESKSSDSSKSDGKSGSESGSGSSSSSSTKSEPKSGSASGKD